MTWTGKLRVKEVNGSIAVATARADEQVWLDNDTNVPAVTSNTEGPIKAVEVRFEFDGDAPLEVGTLLPVSGHFTRTPA